MTRRQIAKRTPTKKYDRWSWSRGIRVRCPLPATRSSSKRLAPIARGWKRPFLDPQHILMPTRWPRTYFLEKLNGAVLRLRQPGLLMHLTGSFIRYILHIDM